MDSFGYGWFCHVSKLMVTIFGSFCFKSWINFLALSLWSWSSMDYMLFFNPSLFTYLKQFTLAKEQVSWQGFPKPKFNSLQNECLSVLIATHCLLLAFLYFHITNILFILIEFSWKIASFTFSMAVIRLPTFEALDMVSYVFLNLSILHWYVWATKCFLRSFSISHEVMC